MRGADSEGSAELVRPAARPLEGAGPDYDYLVSRFGASRSALLGEASHGTKEFYSSRAGIVKRLISEETVTAEDDWAARLAASASGPRSKAVTNCTSKRRG